MQSLDWPNRVVRFIVPFAAGGPTDIVARVVTEQLSKIWGQQAVIENRGGAGTNIGNEMVARSDPDGYTVLFATASLVVNRSLYRSLSYDPIADFAAVSLVSRFSLFMFVPNSLPTKSVMEFVAYAKAHPGKRTLASPGTSSTPHLAGELLKSYSASCWSQRWPYSRLSLFASGVTNHNRPRQALARHPNACVGDAGRATTLVLSFRVFKSFASFYFSASSSLTGGALASGALSGTARGPGGAPVVIACRFLTYRPHRVGGAAPQVGADHVAPPKILPFGAPLPAVSCTSVPQPSSSRYAATRPSVGTACRLCRSAISCSVKARFQTRT